MDELVSSNFCDAPMLGAMLVRHFLLNFMLSVLGSLGSADRVNPLSGQHLRVLAMEV